MAINIPDDMLPKELVDGLWNPSFLPEELNLNEFIRDDTAVRETVVKSLESKQANPVTGDTKGSNDVPIPLTEAEAVEADLQIDNTLARINFTLERISGARLLIDQLAAGKGGELAFSLDISKKRRIRRAVKRIFGYKTDEITYSMYKEAVEARRLIENQEATGYVAGFEEDDEDDD
jgi:hypothetical protein